MRRDLGYFLTLAVVGLVALPADLAAVQVLPLGPSMQLVLAAGLAALTALSAHVGARALADLIERWPQRHRVPWRFWLDVGQVVIVIGGALGMLVAFGLLRSDTLGAIADLTGNEELHAAGWKINAALFGLQFVAFAVALVLGVKRQQSLRRDRLERQLRVLDRQIARQQQLADEQQRTIVAADNTIAKLDRELAGVREQITAWAAERHTRCDYQWQKARIKTVKHQRRLAQRETASPQPTIGIGAQTLRAQDSDPEKRRSAPSEHASLVEPGDVIDAVTHYVARGNHTTAADRSR